MEPWTFARAGQPWLCVSGRGWKRDNATAGWLLRACLALYPFLVTSPTSCMQLAPLQLLSWLWFPGWVGLRMYWQFLLMPQPLLGLQPEVIWLHFPHHWSPGLYGLAWAWAHLLTRCPPDFYPSQVIVELPALLAHHHHTDSSSPLLPISAPPTHWDELNFFKSMVVRLRYSSECFSKWFSGSSGCFSFLS